MLLAGDIGGTKTNLAVFSPERGPRTPLARATYASAQYRSLQDMVKEFLAGVRHPIDRASFGVAGPVENGQAKVTNLPWTMDEGELRDALQLSSVRLINDLEAIAHAVPLLGPGDLASVNEGEAVQGGALGVIAPGTGLGEAFLTWDGNRYRPHSSEGGHTDFAPTNRMERDLLAYLQERFDHVSYERVCSGIGLPNIYAFLKHSSYAEEPGWLTQQLAGAHDPTPVIVNGAQQPPAGEQPSALCSETVRLFVTIMGSEAGNLALKVLATGGIYLAGGIPPRLLRELTDGRFLAAFRQKGRFATMLSRIPIHVIRSADVALIGAASHGLQE